MIDMRRLIAILHDHTGKILISALSVQILHLVYVAAFRMHMPRESVFVLEIVTGFISNIAYLVMIVAILTYAVRFAFERINSE
ncbi:MAG: hypothetical protein OXC95_07060 [Dehalococcoidia bacterium]|nr:hypothetical protein [Dehalococcoidia bacterium]